MPANHTFSGYIAYCAQKGIISGYGDGTFRPAGTLTGYAFMKMLLGALGYDADIEGYSGSNWTVAVAKQAMGIGLDDGNDKFVGTQAVAREEACLYAFNTLTADVVSTAPRPRSTSTVLPSWWAAMRLPRFPTPLRLPSTTTMRLTG
ncbi:MAG: S-layer homology domain-containing protein [Dysosmobacter sp.]